MEILGIFSSILGTILAFRFGFPQPHFEESISLDLPANTRFNDGSTVRGMIDKEKRRKKFYTVMSYIALGFILLGFVLQLTYVLLN